MAALPQDIEANNHANKLITYMLQGHTPVRPQKKQGQKRQNNSCHLCPYVLMCLTARELRRTHRGASLLCGAAERLLFRKA